MNDIDFTDIAGSYPGAVGEYALRGMSSYADLVLRGRIVEPRTAMELPGGGPRILGGVFLGPAETRGDYRCATLWMVGDGTARRLTPRFTDGAQAKRFRARTALRAGPAFGEAMDGESLASLEAHIFYAGLECPLPSVGNAAVGRALEGWLSGGVLGLGGLYGTRTPFEHVLDCGNGLAWHRVATVEGAAIVTGETFVPVNRDFERSLTESHDDEPRRTWYALRPGDGPAVVVASVPRKGSGGSPEVTGRMRGEPFTNFRHDIGMLGDHLRVSIKPVHYRDANPPVGRWDAEMAAFGI